MRIMILLAWVLMVSACSLFEPETPDRPLIDRLPEQEQETLDAELLAFSERQLPLLFSGLAEGGALSNAMDALPTLQNFLSSVEAGLASSTDIGDCLLPLIQPLFLDIYNLNEGFLPSFERHHQQGDCRVTLRFANEGTRAVQKASLAIEMGQQLYVEVQLPTLQQLQGLSGQAGWPFIIRDFRFEKDAIRVEALAMDARLQVRNVFLADLMATEDALSDFDWRRYVWLFEFDEGATIALSNRLLQDARLVLSPTRLLVDNDLFNNSEFLEDEDGFERIDCSRSYHQSCFQQAYADPVVARNTITASLDLFSQVSVQDSRGETQTRRSSLAINPDQGAGVVFRLMEGEPWSVSWADVWLDNHLQLFAGESSAIASEFRVGFALPGMEAMTIGIQGKDIRLTSERLQERAALVLQDPSSLAGRLQADPFSAVAALYFDDAAVGKLELTGELVLGEQRSKKVRLLSIFDLERYRLLLSPATTE